MVTLAINRDALTFAPRLVKSSAAVNDNFRILLAN